MNTLLVVKSTHHFNTAKVADAMAEELDGKIVEPGDVTAEMLDACDLIGIGSGVYFGRMHREVRDFVAGLQPPASPMAAFVFTTSGLPFLHAVWHGPVKRALEQRGYQLLGDFHCRGFDTVGPLWLIGGLNRSHPNEDDLKHAREFALELRHRMHASNEEASDSA